MLCRRNYGPKMTDKFCRYLPLNFIPIVGPAVFVILQGKRTGPNAHSRYFQLKGMNNMQKERHVEERRGAYTG